MKPAKPGRALRTAGVCALCLLVAGGLLVGCSMAAGMGADRIRYRAFSDSLSSVDLPLTDFEASNYDQYGMPDYEKEYAELHEIVARECPEPMEYFAFLGQKGGKGVRYVAWSYQGTGGDDGLPLMLPIPHLSREMPVYAELDGHPENAVNPVPAADPGHWPHYSPRVYAHGESLWTANFYAPEGSDVVAVAAGEVLEVTSYYGSGNIIRIAHSPFETSVYTRCGDVLVKAGDVVDQGQKIATVGVPENTILPHLGFHLSGGSFLYDPDFPAEELLAKLESGQFESLPDSFSMTVPEWNGPHALPAPEATGMRTCKKGIDVIAPDGSPVTAPCYGTVEETGTNAEWGNYLIYTSPSDTSYLFGFCESVAVSVGDRVYKGDTIATAGPQTDHLKEAGFHIKIVRPDFVITKNSFEDRSYTTGYLPALEGELWPNPVPDAVYVTRGMEENHTGVDIAAETGSPIVATGNGLVTYAGTDERYGNYVLIDHGDGITTLYAHCDTLTVAGGQTVSQGQQIATVGSTGYSSDPHCHLEIRQAGNALDPFEYFDLATR